MTDDEAIELWSALSEEDQHILRAGNNAVREVMQQKDKAHWVGIGRSGFVVRTNALRQSGTNSIQHPRYRRAQSLLLSRVPDLARLQAKDSKSYNDAIWLFEHWSELEGWLDGLGPESLQLNHPTSIRNRYRGREGKHMKRRDWQAFDPKTYESLMEFLRRSEDPDAERWMVIFQGLRRVLVRDGMEIDLKDLGLL
jgi:hypothetical protein